MNEQAHEHSWVFRDVCECCYGAFVPLAAVPHPRMPPGLLSSPSRIGRYHGGRMKVPVMKAPHG